MFRIKTRIYEKKTLKIGFLALCGGSGTTHFSLSSANFYRSKFGCRVLYMDCSRYSGEDSGILGLRTEETISISGMSGFRYGRMDFLCGCNIRDVTEIDESKYDVILIRMDGNDEAIGNAGICDQVFFCGSAKPWSYRSLQESFRCMLMNHYHMRGKYVFLDLTKKERMLLKDEFDISAENMPFIADPMFLTKTEADEIGRILPNRYV